MAQTRMRAKSGSPHMHTPQGMQPPLSNEQKAQLSQCLNINQRYFFALFLTNIMDSLPSSTSLRYVTMLFLYLDR